MDDVFPRIEALVTGPDGMQWLDLLYRLQGSRPAEPSAMEMVDELIALGLCANAATGIRLTALGQKCADSAREYILWLQRGRKLHYEDEHDVLDVANFRDKAVLEIGSGWGCNLVRLSTVARRAVGLEIEPVYREFSRILAKREGIDPPEIVLGTGETSPFSAGEFDWVLLFSALQYMDIHDALAEFKRLLKPGGLVLTTQRLLPDIVGTHLQRIVREKTARSLLSTGAILTNTLWYQCFGRRLRTNVQGDATARPVYPTKSFLIGAAKEAGLGFRSDLSFHREGAFGLVLQNS